MCGETHKEIGNWRKKNRINVLKTRLISTWFIEWNYYCAHNESNYLTLCQWPKIRVKKPVSGTKPEVRDPPKKNVNNHYDEPEIYKKKFSYEHFRFLYFLFISHNLIFIETRNFIYFFSGKKVRNFKFHRFLFDRLRKYEIK
jgi:hypothetical protein